MVRLLAFLLFFPMAQDPVRLGQEAFSRRDFAAAERWFRRAVESHPNSARAHKLLGMTFAARDDYRRAVEPFRSACRIDPREENACYYLGRALYSLSRFEEARRAFATALEHSASRGRPLLGLATALEALGLNSDAEKAFRESIDAGEQRALIDYGLFLHRQGRGRESIEYLRKANAVEQLESITRSVEAAGAGTREPQARPGPDAPPGLHFEPVPLEMVVRNGAAGKKHLIETMLAGVAVLDFDNDGWLDIFVSNGAAIPGLRKEDGGYWNRLFRNRQDGTFEDVTRAACLQGSGYSMGAAAADYDNDGWTDLFVTGVRGNSLYRNLGNGAFADVTTRAGVEGDGSWAVAAGWTDYDNDGFLDLFVVNYVVWDPATEITCGPGIEGHRSYCHPRYYKPVPNALYRNLGNGSFRDVSVESGIAAHSGKGMGASFGDYDLDGFVDIFVANDTVANFLFHNERNGAFAETGLKAGVAYNTYGVAISSMGADFRDFDNDGREDLFVTALSNEMFPLFRNLGGGRFADVGGPVRLSAESMPWSGWGNGSYDFDNDGWRDFFSANGHAVDNVDLISSRAARQPNVVFLSRRAEIFEAKPIGNPALHRGAAFGDIDRDGRMDAVVTRLNEAPLVLRNRSAGTGNWIRFLLKGTRSNRDAIGARIEIESEIGRQWNRVNTCIGYAGSSERAVHFGLGAAAKTARVKITWPSGKIQMLENLSAGRVHEITEPDQGEPAGEGVTRHEDPGRSK